MEPTDDLLNANGKIKPYKPPQVEEIGEKEYVIFDNPEKKEKRRLGDYRYMPLNTSRILLSGLPGVGKRNLILNMVYKMNPPPSYIHIVHIDPLTHEYDALNSIAPVLMYSPDDFPTAGNIEKPEEDSGDDAQHSESGSEDENEKKGSPLIIIDEITTDQLNKEGIKRFERLVNYVCTHRDATLMCSIQSMMNIPAKVRRSFNNMALWIQNDMILNKIMSARCGVAPELLKLLFNLCKDKYDFIYIDADEERDSEWRYRLNWMHPITLTNAVEPTEPTAPIAKSVTE
jgi:hypothetical protein